MDDEDLNDILTTTPACNMRLHRSAAKRLLKELDANKDYWCGEDPEIAKVMAHPPAQVRAAIAVLAKGLGDDASWAPMAYCWAVSAQVHASHPQGAFTPAFQRVLRASGEAGVKVSEVVDKDCFKLALAAFKKDELPLTVSELGETL